MHSGGGGASSVVSVAPATPMVKHMTGIAAIVLEGREKSELLVAAATAAAATTTASTSKSTKDTAMSIRGSAGATSSSLLYATTTSFDPVAAAMATTATTTSNWARAQNNRLAHIYRLKNRLLVEQHHQQRSSPVPDYDPVAMAMGDEEAAVVAAFGSGGGGGVFDPLQHLTTRTSRMTTPRSFMNLQMDKRHISSSSSSSTSSSGGASAMTSGGGSSGGCVASVNTAVPSAPVAPAATVTSAGVVGRRNSRSSPVPAVIMSATTHCDDFLRTIGLLKAPGNGGPSGSAVGVALKKMPVDECLDDESHYCNEVLNGECFRWQQFLRKIETLLCRGSSVCIEVSLGPEAHPLLLEQWVIQRVDRPSQPSMTIQSLCSAIRSQLHFSQISAWSDLLDQQYTDYGFYQEHILNNPRITVNRATNRPRLDLLYRVKCASQKGTFERPPLVHNFPNVILDVYTGIAVSLRSLPRLERIPRLSVENKKSEMEVTVPESPILPNPVKVCCQEKGKHRCLTLDELVHGQQQKQQQQQHVVMVTEAGGSLASCSSSSSSSGVSSQNNNNLVHGGTAVPGCSNSSGGTAVVVMNPAAPLSHREKQLLKYKRRLLKRDKGKGKTGDDSVDGGRNTVVVGVTNNKNLGGGGEKLQNVPASINDLCLPLYTDVEVTTTTTTTASSSRSTPMSCEKEESLNCQDVGTQTDLHMAIDDVLVEMDVDVDDAAAATTVPEDVPMALERANVSCGKCNKQMHLICWHCCDNNNSSSSKRFHKLCEKYRNAMAKQRGGGAGGHASRVFYKLPKNRSMLVRRMSSGSGGGGSKDKRLNGKVVAMTTAAAGPVSLAVSSDDDVGGGCSGTSLDSDDADDSGGNGWTGNQFNQEDNNNLSNMANRNVEAAAATLKQKQKDESICDNNASQGNWMKKVNPPMMVVRDEHQQDVSMADDDDDCNLCVQKKVKINKRQAEHIAQELCYLTPTNEPSRCAGVKQKVARAATTTAEEDKEDQMRNKKEFHTNNMKLSKQEHETRADQSSCTPTSVKVPQTSSSSSFSSTSPTSHCIKNLTSIFANASSDLETRQTPQMVLKRLNLMPTADGAGDVFNFDLKTSPGANDDEDLSMEGPIKGSGTLSKARFGTGGVKKSLSTPSAFSDGALEAGGLGNKTSPTPNSLSPRFLKSASVYNKKRRSRHLSDRSSERSSVCSDELSLSDDETLLLTPNGSNLLLTSSSSMSPLLLSPVMPGRAILGPDGKLTGRTAAAGALFKSVFGQRPLLGSIEESLLQKRLTPKFLVSGFRVLLGASGGFCPKQLTIPAKTFFYELSGQSQTTPYMSEVRLPRKGYTIPRSGTVQVTLLNPLGTFVHMFVVPYDFREMPAMSTTFIRQRSLMFDDTISSTTGKTVTQLSTEEQMKLLRYVIHLRFQTTRSGRLVLHTDIRMLISRRTDHDTAAAHAKGALESPNELKTITIMPENPRFSDRIDKV